MLTRSLPSFSLSALVSVSALVLLTSVASADRPKVAEDEKNIVAKRLPGVWAINAELSQRLTGKAKHKIATLEFRSDAGVAPMVPADLVKKLKSPIYLSGWMVINKTKTFPFILIALGGNPHVVFFEKRDGNPMGDSESFYVMLPQAKDKANDLLFLGGDMPREPFLAFVRTR